MKVSTQVANLSVQYRWIGLILALVLFAASFTGFKHFVFDSTPRAFFSDDYPYLQQFDEVEDKYGKDSRMFIMMSSDEGTLFTPSALSALMALTEESWTLPGALRVDSLANFQYSYSEDDDIVIDALYDSSEALTPEAVKRIERIAMASPDVIDRLVNKAGTHASITVALSRHDTQEEGQAEETASALAVYALTESIESRYPGVKTWVTGNAISNYHNLTIATNDIITMVPVMFLLMFVMVGVLMRSITGVTVSLVIAIMATIGAIGFSSLFGTVYSTLAINAVIIGITVAIAHCIHIISYFLHSYYSNDKLEAIRLSLRVNFMPVSITSLTTGLGFLSLNFTDLPPAAHLGNASAMSVLLAWLFSYTVLPALLSIMPVRKPKKAETNTEATMLKLANWVIARQRGLLIGSIVFSVLMLALASQNTINDRFSEMIKKPHEFRTDNAAVDQQFGGLYNVNYDINADSEGGITDPAYMAELEKFVSWLREQPEVTSVYSVTDTIKRLNKNMHGDDDAYYRIPDNKDLTAQLLLMYEMSVPLGVDLNNMISPDKSATRVLITTKSMDTAKVFALQDKVADWQAQNLPKNQRHPGASLAIMWSHLSIDSLVSSIEGSFVALAIISAVLMLVLGSFRYGLISIVPNIIPAAVGFGVWAVISGELGLGLTTVVIITMGIIVDDTVHFLSKYQFARQHEALDAEDSVRYAFKHVGTPLWITTAALASGFAILTLSQVHGNADLGLLTSIILIAALILDFILLPALLMFIDKGKGVKSSI
ncbi:Uncharacterised protein [BD1-7 clade bacterium]|uniref:SSD domain-containing protein n=1 Tax=BD1-7 clade bacterium TaxID=2029982 RepID=A0A5S9R1J9_9GAMM|nr:Uncharacterised protein [BD1-7 clade bacterium]